MLSEYKYIFGVPKTGLHSYRLLDVAIIDYLMTIIASFMVSYITKIPVVLSTIGMFIMGILLHLLFGLDTNTIKYLRQS
jgi:hypothetical protein